MNKSILLSIGAAWVIILFNSCGENKNKPSETTTAVSSEKVSENILTSGAAVSGEEIYNKTCLACHQANGEGIVNTFPPLAKSDYLINKDSVIAQVIHGKSGAMVVNGITYNNTMPPQALSDDEIASVLTYVYGSWGNSGGVITSSEVNAVRRNVK